MFTKKWMSAAVIAIASAAFVVPVAEAATHTVQSGDTLTKIASKYNTTVENLIELNKLTSDAIYVNQQLIVSNEQKPSTSNVEKPTRSSIIKRYQVQSGDTLTKIASKHQTTIAKLREWNQLTSDQIFIGQMLIVQKNAPSHFVAIGINRPTSQATVTSTNTNEIGLQVDAMIEKQLASEKKIVTAPSAASLKMYENILNLANDLRGIPYVFGGNTPVGFDCSGFIAYVHNEVGMSIARKSSLDYFLNDTVTVENPVPGDLVFFKNTYIATISHMGIYIGDNQMIHAGSNGIEVTNLSYKYWADRFVAFKRFNQVN